MGGGPVGSLLAVILAQRGHSVTVYEKRPDPRQAGNTGGRAEAALKLTVPVTGRMVHEPDGRTFRQPYGRDDTECNYSVSRGGLNTFLIDAAEKEGVTFHFGHALVDADIESGRWEFETGDGTRTHVEAATVYGCDGVASAVRAAFEALPDFSGRIDMLPHGYKELTIPAGSDGTYLLDCSALHIWPRESFMLMALANQGGSFTVTLFAPHEGVDAFAALDSEAAVQTWFETHFASAVPLMPGLQEEFFTNPTGELGTVRCSPWNYRDRVILLGDAAHAIVPFFGQGMNSGFEDCRVLDDLMQQHGEDLTQAFSEYTRLRKPADDAIADMALENFVEMRDRVDDPKFVFRKAVEQILEREMPSLYRSRYSMVMYSHIPFHHCQQAGIIQQNILSELCHELDSPASLDLNHARTVIERDLTPFFQEHEITLDY
jgi:kynurenine 3-monooxygenase